VLLKKEAISKSTQIERNSASLQTTPELNLRGEGQRLKQV
jgi:hypothetical protein